MKPLLTSVALASMLATSTLTPTPSHAQAYVQYYEVWYTRSAHTGGTCIYATGAWSCVWAPSGNVAWEALAAQYAAAFYNAGTPLATYLDDGDTVYLTTYHP